MIEIRDERPQNSAHFARLLSFYREIASICLDLHITPLLSGSLAVFAYTRDRAMRVNDIDLACPEAAFPQLCPALAVREIAFEVKAWHVLQARRDDLKIEFDSLEYWFAGLPTDHDTLSIGGCQFNIVDLPCLRTLYQRGLVATAQQHDTTSRAKHAAIAEKYGALCRL